MLYLKAKFDRLYKRLRTWVIFQINHDCTLICTDEPTRRRGSKESYWHIDKCWCGRRATGLNGWCDGDTQKLW